MTSPVIRHIISTAGALVPLSYLAGKSDFRLVLPSWHCVAEETPPHIKHLYHASDPRSFRRDMKILVKNFRPVSAQEVLLHVTGAKPFTRPSMLLSFDDGLREADEIIAPILTELGVPAVFFVNTAFVDNKDMFYRFKVSLLIDRLKQMKSPGGIYEIISGRNPVAIRSKRQLQRYLMSLSYQDNSKINSIAELFDLDFSTYLKIRKPYMTSSQLSGLVEQGFEIGAHSIDHPLYSSIPAEEQIRQTRESLGWLRRNFKIKTACFAFPFTDSGVGRDFFEEIFADHPENPDLTFGTAGMKNDIWQRHLQRIPAGSGSPGVKGLMRSEYLLYNLKKLSGRHYVKR